MKRWGLISVFSVLVFMLSLVFGSIASAQQQREVEVDGLIVDQTQTRIGQEFYWNFVNVWEAPIGIKDHYNIFIIERASPAWGSWIWIEVGGFVSKEIVYREMLKPRVEEIEKTAKKGVEVVKEHLYHLKEYGKELGERDMAGTGIY